MVDHKVESSGNIGKILDESAGCSTWHSQAQLLLSSPEFQHCNPGRSDHSLPLLHAYLGTQHATLGTPTHMVLVTEPGVRRSARQSEPSIASSCRSYLPAATMSQPAATDGSNHNWRPTPTPNPYSYSHYHAAHTAQPGLNSCQAVASFTWCPIYVLCISCFPGHPWCKAQRCKAIRRSPF